MRFWNTLRRWFRRPAFTISSIWKTSPEPSVQVFVSVNGADHVCVGTFETRILANEAAEQWAARHVFKTGEAASFAFTFEGGR